MIRLIYHGESELAFIGECHANYQNYLVSIKDTAPRSAYEFAAADWHYSHLDRRCPHGAKIISVEMSYVTPPDRPDEKHLEIKVGLKGAWNEDELVLTYKNVEYYDLQKSPLTGLPAKHFKRPHSAHGDWLVDEMHLSSEGLVVHEIAWAFGASWTVQCEDIEYNWFPGDCCEDRSPTEVIEKLDHRKA